MGKGKEKMNDRRAENYIHGSSLSARRSSVLKNDELRLWLSEMLERLIKDQIVKR